MRAALLFDRIAVMPPSWSGSVNLIVNWGSRSWLPPPEIQWDAYEAAWESRDEGTSISDLANRCNTNVQRLTEYNTNCAIRLLAELHRKRGLDVVPVYLTLSQFSSVFPTGHFPICQALIQNIPDVVEDELEWDQIIEFRKDKDNLWRYRAMRLWLTDAMQAKSPAHARDLIADKLYRYEEALAKHGMKTVIGGFSTILDSKALATVTGAASLAAWLKGPIWATLTAGAITAGKIALWVAQRKIEREEVIHGPGSEVAIIYEANRL